MGRLLRYIVCVYYHTCGNKSSTMIGNFTAICSYIHHLFFQICFYEVTDIFNLTFELTEKKISFIFYYH